jgi:two-component system, OmpR family, sensor histidine kinase KdpD
MFGARRLLRSAASVPILVLVTAFSYRIQANPLTAGLVDLLLVMAIAFRWGFIEAAVVSISAVLSLDYFFAPPIHSLYEENPQDWISSAIFLLIALFVSQFADRLRRQTIAADHERTRLERLYLTSRDIIMMDRRQEIGAQLAGLIHDIFQVDAVAIWDAREPRMDKAGTEIVPEDEVRAAYFNDAPETDLITGRFKRVLRLGIRPVGALYLAASSRDSYLDSKSMDAIASLAALALERAHSFAAESNAEAARRSEQLRSTILDGLAHAFKTPLATIQTASSGLLEIPQLGRTEKELANLIDGEASRLADLTGKVLQTVELAEATLQVDYEKIDLNQFLEDCRESFDPILENHPLRLFCDAKVSFVWADFQLLRMALFQMIDNAAKYARAASPIALRIRSTDSEIVLSVENEGSYIPPEESLRIFERFYRSPDAQYKAPGTGIGLSVTKRIAEAHRGDVWVESDPGMNTTFFLSLPQIRKEA